MLIYSVGFSFGGMLAMCITSQLWHCAMADQQALSERIICITFGQPLMQLKMVEEQISFSPQFEQSIHCVFRQEDVFPVVLSYIPTDEKTPIPNMSPPSHSEAKALVARSETSEATTQSTSEPVGFITCSKIILEVFSQVSIFSHPFVKSFLQNLSLVQENFKSEVCTFFAYFMLFFANTAA